MKKIAVFLLTLLMIAGMAVLSGCSAPAEDPGPPPTEVIHPEGAEESETNSPVVPEGDVLENAVTVRIGQGESENWAVDMYNNTAANTMLGYLSNSPLLFPTYTYDEENGFVAQTVRGSYTRDEEITVEDVKAGELYLFGDRQLRFYFKDVQGANITATPVGYYADTEGLTEAVQEAYESNLEDVWHVSVYFIRSLMRGKKR